MAHPFSAPEPTVPGKGDTRDSLTGQLPRVGQSLSAQEPVAFLILEAAAPLVEGHASATHEEWHSRDLMEHASGVFPGGLPTEEGPLNREGLPAEKCHVQG